MDMTLPEAVLDVINNKGTDGLSAREIQDAILTEGFASNTENLTAAIIMACQRLDQRGKIEIEQTSDGKKRFKKLITPPPESPTPLKTQ
jgi:hypothetical protein